MPTMMSTMNTTSRNHDDKQLKQGSMRLSWLLRHGANESQLAMDTAGFASVADVLRHARLDHDTLLAVVADNNKQRFELVGDGKAARIRAVQGHSLERTPVTLDGLEASWVVVDDERPLFHGTSVAAAQAILASDGVHAAARSHVHLADAVDATVGKRAAVDVLLRIDPTRLRAAGQRVFRAPNGVLLTRAVPKAAVVDVVASSRAGDRAIAMLRALVA